MRKGTVILCVLIILMGIVGCGREFPRSVAEISSTTPTDISNTDEANVTGMPPSPTLTDHEQWQQVEEQRKQEMQELLVMPTQGPEPHSIFDVSNENKVGDVVIFGEYAHNKTMDYTWYSKQSEQIPLKWLVLEIRDEKMLLVTVKNIEVMPHLNLYSEQFTGVYETTWESSDIRQWLNETFFEKAFTEEERCCIADTEVVTNEKNSYGSEEGNCTTDKVFLLSAEEAEKYFASNVERRTQTEPEVYIENHNWDLVAYQHYPNITDYYGWWLRTPGESNESMAYVSKTGEIIDKGTFVADEMLSVRPAMWVDLNKVKEVGLETKTEE